MKQIFDDIRREIDIHSDEACFMPNDMMVISESWMLKKLDEAEAKWNTTEAEVIEKFAEKLGEAFSEKSSEIKVDGMTFDILTLDSVIEIMWDLAEQLKEE